MDKIYNVGIVGGGVSGVVIALELAELGIDHVLFEQENSVIISNEKSIDLVIHNIQKEPKYVKVNGVKDLKVSPAVPITSSYITVLALSLTDAGYQTSIVIGRSYNGSLPSLEFKTST